MLATIARGSTCRVQFLQAPSLCNRAQITNRAAPKAISQPLPQHQKLPQSAACEQPPEHVFLHGLPFQPIKRMYSTEAPKDVLPNKRQSTAMFSMTGLDGGKLLLPQFGFHGTNTPPDIVFACGMRSPDRIDDFPTDDPDAVKLAMRQNTTSAEEGHYNALKGDTAYYGHQFVSMSKDFMVSAEFATRRALEYTPGEDTYVYEIDVKYLVHHGFLVCDANREARSHHHPEHEIGTLHYIPPEAIKQVWVGKYDAKRGGHVPQDKPILNPRYGEEPSLEPVGPRNTRYLPSNFTFLQEAEM